MTYGSIRRTSLKRERLNGRVFKQAQRMLRRLSKERELPSNRPCPTGQGHERFEV